MNELKKHLNNFQGCEICFDKYFDIIDCLGEENLESTIQLWKVLNKLEIDSKELSNINGKLKCCKCGENLGLNYRLISDAESFFEEFIEIVSDYINKEVYECEYCNSDIIPFTQRHGNSLSLNNIYNALFELGIDESFGDVYEKFAYRIKCKCHNELDYDTPFVTKSDKDGWYGRDIKIIINTFDIDEDDARGFIDYLYRYPMLALENRVGNIIFEKIKFKEVQGFINIPIGDIFYRARKRNLRKRNKPYSDLELWAPPLGISTQGRFNPVGVSILYLCDNPMTGFKEINLDFKDRNEVADVGEFVVLENLTVWSIDELDIKDFVLQPSEDEEAKVSREYLLPNFLSQCLALSKVNGIIYESVKNPKSYNLALFTYKMDRTIGLYEIHEDYKI